MQRNSSVEHTGVVESLDDNLVRVGFVSHASCSSCHAKGACSLSELENKFVEVQPDDQSFQVGERVTIVLEQRMGFTALWYGYLLPLLIMVLGLIITYSITGRDGLAGLIAIGLLAPYYLGLYLFRSSLQKIFEFRLRKIQ